MNKKLTAFAFVLIFIFAFAIPAFAVPEPPTSGTVPTERLYPLLVDDANLLSSDEEASLLLKLEEISSRQEMDVAVITVETLGSRNVETYTDDFYDYYGYGQGNGKDGVMFLISMGERQAHMTAVGKGIKTFTDAGRDFILDEYVMPQIKKGNYAQAFDDFATQCDEFITQAKTASPFDVGNMPKGKFKRPDDIWIVVAVVAGLIAAFAVSSKLKKQMKTVEFKEAANEYSVPGSMVITGSFDRFITSRTTQRLIQKESSGGSGGGSTTHTSSSGTTHSGSSRGF